MDKNMNDGISDTGFATAGTQSLLTVAPTYLSIECFAGQLGLSVATVRRRIADGSIPHTQLGGKRHRITIPAYALDIRHSPMPASGSAPAGLATPELVGNTVGSDLSSGSGPGRGLRGPAPKWNQ